MGYGDKILKPNFSYWTFISNRFIKFYPIHWLCLLFSIPIVIIEGKWLTSTFCLNTLLLQTWVPLSEVYFSFNSVSWYLADTVFLALIFPFLCRFVLKLSIRTRIILIVIELIIYIVIQYLLFSRHVYAFIYINPISRIPDFLLGIMLAILYKDIKDSKYDRFLYRGEKHRVLLLLICFFSIGGLIYFSTLLTNRQSFISMFYWPFIIVIIGTAYMLGQSHQNNILRNKWLVDLGSVSYEFYMIHQLVIRYTNYFCESSVCDNLFFVAEVSIIFTVVVSFLVKYIYERPVSQWLSSNIVKKNDDYSN